MMKNVVDPLFNGVAYWTLAYGFSVMAENVDKEHFEGSLLPYVAWGDFLVDSLSPTMGELFAKFTFRLSLSAVATTIVSGAMSERITFKAYCLFALFNTLAFSLPGYWIWAEEGFLYKLKAVDIAGATTLHLVGGMAGLCATLYLGPRTGRFEGISGSSTNLMWATAASSLPGEQGEEGSIFSSVILHSPTNALLGALMLWWGWLGLNMGSTFGVSGHKWKYASRASVATMLAAAAGGFNGLIMSYFTRKKKLDIIIFIVGLLSSLVAISAGCTLYQPWEALLVGYVGSTLAILTVTLLNWLHIDDPTNSIAIHLPASIWAMVAVSLLVEKDTLLELTYGQSGLLRGGSVDFLLSQCAALSTIGLYSAVVTVLLLAFVSLFTHLRLSAAEEEQGADAVEHAIDYKSNDDTILPLSITHVLSLGLQPEGDLNPTVFARRRLRRLVAKMKKTHTMGGLVDQDLQKRLREQQTKNLAVSWPKTKIDPFLQ